MQKIKTFILAFLVALIISIIGLFCLYKFVLLPKTTQAIEIIDDTKTAEVTNIIDGTIAEENFIEHIINIELGKSLNDITMSFVGDIYLSDYVLNTYNQDGVDGILSEDIHKHFIDTHIVMANQEFAFSNRGVPMEDKEYTFRVDPSYAKIFDEMNIDIVSLANNHALDYGEVALQDTFSALDANNIMYVGAGNNINEAKMAKHFQLKDKTIAVLSASRVIPISTWNAYKNKAGMLTTYDPSVLNSQIAKEKEQSDFVVVYLHWGEELEEMPNSVQQSLARGYIDAGADLVVGSHPHVLQGVEFYKDKPIVYSLGNFMFYYSINQTAILNATLTAENELKLQLIPCKAVNTQTMLVEEEEKKQQFYDYMTSISYNAKIDDEGFITKN